MASILLLQLLTVSVESNIVVIGFTILYLFDVSSFLSFTSSEIIIGFIFGKMWARYQNIRSVFCNCMKLMLGMRHEIIASRVEIVRIINRIFL